MISKNGVFPGGMPLILNQDHAAGRLELESRSAAETSALGSLLAGQLLADDVVSLGGGLGAGKTVLTRGIASGLTCRGDVTSPTFTLLIEHPAALDGLALYHFDAYRLENAAEFCAAGLDEYFDAGGVCVIEWGEIIASVLPERTLTILLDMMGPDFPERRHICLSWTGQPARLARLADKLSEIRRESDHADLSR
jgi:tRNA threonylcarbamoyladenosine biosynthesis protein TsaE